MTKATLLFALGAVLALGACESGRQEVVALRMARPAPPPQQLAQYADAGRSAPSVGGDILRGAAPTTGAAYEATTGDNPPPAPPVERTPPR
jgi:hypothetical protein